MQHLSFSLPVHMMNRAHQAVAIQKWSVLNIDHSTRSQGGGMHLGEESEGCSVAKSYGRQASHPVQPFHRTLNSAHVAKNHRQNR